MTHQTYLLLLLFLILVWSTGTTSPLARIASFVSVSVSVSISMILTLLLPLFSLLEQVLLAVRLPRRSRFAAPPFVWPGVSLAPSILHVDDFVSLEWNGIHSTDRVAWKVAERRLKRHGMWETWQASSLLTRNGICQQLEEYPFKSSKNALLILMSCVYRYL